MKKLYDRLYGKDTYEKTYGVNTDFLFADALALIIEKLDKLDERK